MIILAIVIFILFSTSALAAPSDPCDCNSAGGCDPSWQFCDEIESYSGGCYQDIPSLYAQCVTCRYQGATCKHSPINYNSADCCGSPGLNCTFAGGTTYRCCPNGYKWDTFLGTCVLPPAANPCAGNGSSIKGNNYCASLGTGKNFCCGAAGSGHCEACCTLANCPGFCQYCNTTGASGTWKCSNQINQDLKSDCGSMYQVCDGTGGCKWIGNTPPADCTWPVPPVFKDGKLYNLVMCTYNCEGECPFPDPYVAQPNNWNFCKTGPADNPYWGFQGAFGGCTRCLSDAMADCVDICVVTEGDGCDNYASVDHPSGCCDHNDECSNNHCCPAGRAWNGTDCGACNPMPTSSNWICNLPHTGGSASCTCGGPCYTASGSVVNCGPTQRCIQYHPDPLGDHDMPTTLKVCSVCQNAADCCVEGMAATLDSTCKACSVDWYLSSGHCCQKASAWDSVLGACKAFEPCYALSLPGFCHSLAPNSPLPTSTWWDNPFTTLCIRSDRTICCYNNSGLYGYLPGEQFYYWHDPKTIKVY